MRNSDAERLLRFVRTARPPVLAVVSATREHDPAPNHDHGDASVGQGTGSGLDGNPGADAADPYEVRRRHADRIVRHWRTELAPLSALPGFAGRFGGPVRDVLAATLQGVLVLSLAQVCEVDDERDLVRLLCQLVLDEELPADWYPTPTNSDGGPAADVDRADSVDSDVSADRADSDVPDSWQQMLLRVPAGVVTLAREMWGVRRLIDKRAEGRWWHRAVANVPAVGVVGATLGERHAAIEIAARAYVALGLARELPGI